MVSSQFGLQCRYLNAGVLYRRASWRRRRFENGLIVKHWAFSTEAAAPNESGHTQIDGPTEAKLSADTAKNKSVIRKYYETVHIAGDHSKIPHYVAADQVRHEPGVRDGLAPFERDLKELTKNRTIDEIKFLLGQRDFVFIAAWRPSVSESDQTWLIAVYRWHAPARTC